MKFVKILIGIKCIKFYYVVIERKLYVYIILYLINFICTKEIVIILQIRNLTFKILLNHLDRTRYTNRLKMYYDSQVYSLMFSNKIIILFYSKTYFIAIIIYS